jgi:hypothetical protein
MESSKPISDIEKLIELAKKEFNEETVYNDIDEFIFKYNIVHGKQRFPCIAFEELYYKLTKKIFDRKYFERKVNPGVNVLDGQVEIDLKSCLLNKDELIGLSLENKKRKEKIKSKKERVKEKRLSEVSKSKSKNECQDPS